MGKKTKEPWPLMQDLMEAAYGRWQKNEGWSFDDFRMSLSDVEALAVHFGKLNYQVCNGGFVQWVDNGYYTPHVMEFLTWHCKNTLEQTDAVKEMTKILEEAARPCLELSEADDRVSYEWDGYEQSDYQDIWDELSGSGFDERYYDIDDKILDAVENHLRTRSEAMAA